MAEWSMFGTNELTDEELDFLRCVEAARPYWPKLHGDNNPVPVIIRAAVLRDVLLGQKILLKNDDGLKHRVIALTPFGIRIQPPEGQTQSGFVEIEGKLDLQHISIKSGETIAPLFLQFCQFDHPIEMTGASMASLSLFGSRFPELCLRDCDIRGPLELSMCGPLPNPIGEDGNGTAMDQGDFWPFKGHIFRKGGDKEPAYVPLDDAPAVFPQPEAGSAEAIPTSDAGRAVPETSESRAKMLVPSSGIRLAECTVNLRSARVDGDCTFRAANFVREFRPLWPADSEEWNKKRNRRYSCAALDMAGIHVAGRIDFGCAVVIGGINLTSCVVGEDVWFMGSRLLSYQQSPSDAPAPNSLNLQHAKIGGGLIFRSSSPGGLPPETYGDARQKWETNIVIGGVVGLGLDVGMLWISDVVAHSWLYSLALNGAHIRNNAIIGPFGSEEAGGHAWIQGSILMPSVQIGGDLQICNSGCPAPKLQTQPSVDTPNIFDLLKLDDPFLDALLCTSIYGNRENFCQLLFTSGQVGGGIAISRSEFRTSVNAYLVEDFIKPSASSAIDLWKTNAGRGLLIDSESALDGALRLSRSEWGKHVDIAPKAVVAVQGQRSFATCIDAKALRVDGDFSLGGPNGSLLGGRVALSEMRVSGNMRIDTVTFGQPRNCDPKGKQAANDWLSLDSTHVGGKLTVERLGWSVPASEAPDKEGFLDGPWRFKSIACYPSALIAEQQRPDSIVRALFFPNGLGDSKPSHFILDGTSPVIHNLNRQEPSPLHLESKEQRLSYLAFFCDNVHGEDGPFRIVQSIDSSRIEPPPAGEEPVRLEALSDTIEQEIEVADGTTAWNVSITVIYGKHVFGADMQIKRDGMIEMLDDRPIRALKEELPPDKGMLRAPHMPHWLKQLAYGRELGLLQWNRLRYARRQLQQQRKLHSPAVSSAVDTPRTVNLSRLRCAFLDDEFGNGWGLTEGLRLSVIGIHCDHVEHTSEQNAVGADFAFSAPSRNEKETDVSKAKYRFEKAQDDGAAPKQRATFNRLQWLHMQFPSQPIPQWRSKLANALLQIGAAVPPLNKAFRYLAEPLVRRRPQITSREFAPQCWDMFAMSDLRAGEREKGHAIIVDRSRQTAKIAALQLRDALRRPWGKFWSIIVPLATLGIWLFWNPDQWTNWRPGALALGIIAMSQSAPTLLRIGDWLFRWGFSYGLSSARALRTIVLLLAIGTAATHLARTGTIISPGGNWDERLWVSNGEAGGRELKPEIALVLAVAYDADKKPENRTDTVGPVLAGNVVFADAAPCIFGVTSSLYALDVFVPVLDLEQESRCTIREQQEGAEGSDPYAWWRYAKSFYEILGWVVISLTILTISGVMRRDMER